MAQLRHIMHRGSDGAVQAPARRPFLPAQMRPRAQSGRQPGIARHGQRQMPCAAQGRHRVAQGGAVGRVIMPEHHAAEAPWQVADCWQRVGQALGIGKEPERGRSTAPLYRAGPGD